MNNKDRADLAEAVGRNLKAHFPQCEPALLDQKIRIDGHVIAERDGYEIRALYVTPDESSTDVGYAEVWYRPLREIAVDPALFNQVRHHALTRYAECLTDAGYGVESLGGHLRVTDSENY